MGFSSWFYIEAKVFELLVEERGIQFYVSSKGVEGYPEQCSLVRLVWRGSWPRWRCWFKGRVPDFRISLISSWLCQC
jgi:hypothetical protein